MSRPDLSLHSMHTDAQSRVCPGGVWTTASFALRVLSRAEKEVKTKLKSDKDVIPHASPSPALAAGGYGYGSPGMGSPALYAGSGAGTPHMLPGRSPNGLMSRTPSYFGASAGAVQNGAATLGVVVQPGERLSPGLDSKMR